ncbi:MAG TPA: lysophospholipid acyltransferase family protein [Acidimicrobiia bacterium]|nr:lysophospholipid acyltransferase family protein [Acidimicrobiia bacterium]
MSRRGFPLRAPTWPGTVPRPPAPSRTGLDFDTAWARTPAARVARAALVDLAIRPAVHVLASPAVDGRERLASVAAPVIFAANHHSHLDTGLLLSQLPERFRRKTVVAAAADYFFDRRGKGTLHALAFGAVPMERTKVNRRSAVVATDLLADGWSLVIFPEGGRSPDGWAQEFRGGAAYLAVRSGRPVVPVYLEGTRHVWPKGQRLPRPHKVTVTFGTPISPDPGEDARRLAARLQRAVAALADERATDWWTARRRAAEGATPAITGPEAAAWRRSWALPSR